MPDDANGHITLHLCPVSVWEAQRQNSDYLPEAFGQDGFVHCTDGNERLVMVANMFYSGDPRAFLALSVDLGSNGERWIYEDPERVFPHIYGPIHPKSVVLVRTVRRDSSGKFLGIGEPVETPDTFQVG